jgi:beta-N-acetylhexosaminidase
MWFVGRMGPLAIFLSLVCLLPLPGVAAKKPAVASKKTASKSSAKKAPAPTLTEAAIAAHWAKSLTLREKVAQLVVVQFNGRPMGTRSREARKFATLMAKERVGGLVLINAPNGHPGNRADPVEVATFLNTLQSAAKVPLLVAGDFERGVSMRVDFTTVFPPRPPGRRDHRERSAGARFSLDFLSRRRRQQ